MSDEVTSWLARAALPLACLTAGAPTTDLQPLKGVLDGVRVVGLGEATHGTREFFQLKHRLLEFLVTELGFSVLAMEASASAAPAVDAYVRHGGAVPSLGRHLHSRYGDAYYALGLLFGRGAFRARRMRLRSRARPRAGAVVTHRIGPPRAGTVEARLAAARPGDHLVDLRSAADAPAAVREWLDGSGFSRGFGAMVPRWTYRFQQRPLSPAAEFDGLVYIAESSASRPLSL
ncbi:erythromycin esterase family protein [Streptomyces sp. NPDC006197]|uniref:erythromycin esterase family protein n=1 Tax=Streptomyces sp. NPDC006197 TaxID=3156685 RepID=UPI0033AC82D4